MATRTNGGNVRRRKRRRQRYKRSIMLVSTVVLLLSAMILFQSVTLQAKNKEYKRQEAELTSQIEEEKNRSAEIEEYRAYVQTDEYIKEIAREKLGLVDPDEILFKPAE